ncbi:MAG: heme o synthase [Chlamydiales bacterium]
MINYYLITKPGIILGNLFTLAAGFILASQMHIDLALFSLTTLGLALVIASACIFNNYIDRELDQKMKRTQNRPLAKGTMSTVRALILGTLLGLVGGFTIFWFTNLSAFVITVLGFFIYVFVYSLWKRHTIYSTAIGSIAGAVPPLIGYCAVRNQCDLGAFLLFLVLVLWQMPHFFSIALHHFDDYCAAQIPVLPVKRSLLKTKVHMLIYIIFFIVASSLLTYFQYTGLIYLLITLPIGITWLVICLKGFKTQDIKSWGGSMFRWSLVMIGTVSIVIPLEAALINLRS